MNRTDSGGGDTNNLANLILLIQELIANFESGGSSNNNEDSFWKDTTRTLLVMIIELVNLANGKITWQLIRKIAIDGFSEEDVALFSDLLMILETKKEDSEEWKNANVAYIDWSSKNTFIQYFDLANDRDDLTKEEVEMMQTLGRYWLVEFPKFNGKTKSIIMQMIISVMDR